MEGKGSAQKPKTKNKQIGILSSLAQQNAEEASNLRGKEEQEMKRIKKENLFLQPKKNQKRWFEQWKKEPKKKQKRNFPSKFLFKNGRNSSKKK